MPIRSEFETLSPARALERLSVVAALLGALMVASANAASPDLLQPDLLPSSTWGSGPMMTPLAQLIRHEGPIRGEEPGPTATPETSSAVLLARARIGSAGHADQTTAGTPYLGERAWPRPPADMVPGTRPTPGLEPVAYASQPRR